VASHQPRVSIGMPIYNEEKFLREAIDSLLAQDFADFELIICDNASQDATPGICREYAARDPRIRYHRNATNIGACENFNQVFRLSSGGEYFMWAGGHDVWVPTYLSRCVEVLESDASIVQCNSVAHYMSHDGKDLGPIRQIDTRPYSMFVRANLVRFQASIFLIYAVYRSSTLRQVGLLSREALGSDLLLGFELSLRGPFAVVPEPLYFMRDNRGGHSRPISRAQGNELFRKRMFAGGTAPNVRVWRMNMSVLWRVLKRAPISSGQRIALMGGIIPLYPLMLYPYLPRVVRRGVGRALGAFADMSLKRPPANPRVSGKP
jgi:glycosyltransferase involved in cell wall biosynthesis